MLKGDMVYVIVCSDIYGNDIELSKYDSYTRAYHEVNLLQKLYHDGVYHIVEKPKDTV